MKRKLFLSLFTIVFMTTSLAAQRAGRFGPGRGGGPQGVDSEVDGAIHMRDRCCPVIPPRKVLGRVLEMTEE